MKKNTHLHLLEDALEGAVKLIRVFGLFTWREKSEQQGVTINFLPFCQLLLIQLSFIKTKTRIILEFFNENWNPTTVILVTTIVLPIFFFSSCWEGDKLLPLASSHPSYLPFLFSTRFPACLSYMSMKLNTKWELLLVKRITVNTYQKCNKLQPCLDKSISGKKLKLTVVSHLLIQVTLQNISKTDNSALHVSVF